jgi:hypothetical protein
VWAGFDSLLRTLVFVLSNVDIAFKYLKPSNARGTGLRSETCTESEYLCNVSGEIDVDD